MPSSSLVETGGKVLAAIDASHFSPSVCDHAAWAAGGLGAPMEILHVLDRHLETAPVFDLSGNLDLGAHESLMQELTNIDERRSKLAQERGRLLLETAKERAERAGVPGAETRMLNGAVVETLTEREPHVRLFVLGKQGRHAGAAKGHLGGNLERVVRAVHRPILVVPRVYRPVQRVLIAFDGSATMRTGVERVARSPLFRGTACTLLMAGAEGTAQVESLQWAKAKLEESGIPSETVTVPGHAEAVIPDYVRGHPIDLLVMGAYGHSRIRQLVVGSTTTSLLRTCEVPMLLLR